MATKTLKLGEKINRAIKFNGRTQKWIVSQMKAAGIDISEPSFSLKKDGSLPFKENELEKLSELLETDLTK